MFDPKGAIVRRMRLTETATDADGTERKKMISAGGVIVVIRGNSLSRKKFREFCQHRGIVAHAVERAGNVNGRFNRRTGAETATDYREDADVTAWQVMGDGEALSALVGMDDEGRPGTPKAFVDSWHFAIGVRPPLSAQGSGPEKVRPPMGSMFGKPQTLSATATALTDGRSKRAIAERKTGNL